MGEVPAVGVGEWKETRGDGRSAQETEFTARKNARVICWAKSG